MPDSPRLPESPRTSAARRFVAGALSLLQLGSERGVAADVVLAGSDITLTQLYHPDATLTLPQELRTVANLLAALGEPPHLGLDAGSRLHLSAFGIWGYALVSSRDLRSAAAVGARYTTLTSGLCEVVNRQGPDGLTMVIDPAPVPPPLRRFAVQRCAAALQTIYRELVPSAHRFHRVGFTFDVPDPERARYRQLFGLEPVFGAAENTLVVTTAALDAPLPQADPAAARAAERQCRELLTSMRARAGTSGQVRDALLAYPQTPPSLETVAAGLHVSTRTLRRRLAEEGTSYRELVGEIRETLAVELLGQGRLTVAEVATRLGYAETSSFTHAFRRWKGTGPRAHRRAVSLEGAGIR